MITGSFHVLKIKTLGRNVSNNKQNLPNNTEGEGNFYNFHGGPMFIEATTVSYPFLLFSLLFWASSFLIFKVFYGIPIAFVISHLELIKKNHHWIKLGLVLVYSLLKIYV